MVESQKEAAATANSKNKSSLLDEEIGKDFFSSWKSMSVAEDDVLDFSSESLPKGKKNTFSFDKLDMDFGLDGDFDKISSSFKVDMPDLDFSSPPKRLGKPNERTGKESTNGKNEDKQDQFSFNFDFNALDSFDLDSSWMKGEQKSNKGAESTHEKSLDSLREHEKNQNFRSNLAIGIDAFEGSEAKMFPTLKSVTTSKVEHPAGGSRNHNSIIDSSPSTSANFGNLNEPNAATTPEKEITSRAKVTDQVSLQSNRTVSMEPNSQHTTQDLCIPSVSSDDSIQESVPELQAEFSSGTKVNTTKGGEQDAGSFNLEYSSPINITGLQSTNKEFGRKLENKNLVPMGDLNGGASVQGDTDFEDTSIASVSQETVRSNKLTKENSNSVSKLLLAPLHSDPKVHSLMQTKEKGIGHTHLKPVNRSDETEAQVNTASVPKKICSLNDKRTETMCLSPVHERRQDFSAGDAQAQAGDRNVSTSKYFDRAGRKGVPITLESPKNNMEHNSSSSQVHPASLPELKTKSSALKCINPKLSVSSIAPLKNYKSISVTRNDISPPNVLKKALDNSSLKVSRAMTSKNDLPHSTAQRELKSLRPTNVNKEMHVNTAPETAYAVAAEKHGLLSPSLKRKKLEVSDADPANSYPLKRTTEPSSESRKASDPSEQIDKKMVPNTENQPSIYSSTSALDVPLHASLTEFRVPLTMENDGIVEKAEACAKELEDICNMLKKKHEEAKEILVRAIVNNNNLLMLNHPIYEEKISFGIGHMFASVRSWLFWSWQSKLALNVGITVFHIIPSMVYE
ncbi:hypothetical protein BVC80_7691g2 [Macleaya cordata]|uniref:Uncharacterized protein n=1 Tax=Macleaya cordata TaxID=56857 RepID=A0A200PTG6_MACCD|nr:hypothetical protein BVC80_7691g2 [Macleaya cordata]